MTKLNRYQDAQCDGAMARVRRDCRILRQHIQDPGYFQPLWIEAFAIGWVFGT